jgi:NAD(P)-dependent dehydrogenase (short-subunit alcohol dehydrogenase family)
MTTSFSGRTALLTGGASGIGAATARLLASHGARVVIGDLHEEGCQRVVREIESAGGEAIWVKVDVRRDEDLEAVVREAVSRFGGLQIAVNAAGVGGVRAATDAYPVEDWGDVLDINLTGVWRSMRYEIPAILGGGGGAIVNIASVAGVVGFANHSAYAASKHGVIGLTRSAALEYARKGIRINAVCPAFTRTPMVEQMVGGDPLREERLAQANPMGRLGTPEEIASSILYLCSDDSSFVTGHSLVLDGGLTAM